MRFLPLLVTLAGLAGCVAPTGPGSSPEARPRAGGKGDLFGEDGRSELFDYRSDHPFRQWARSAALVVLRERVTCDGDAADAPCTLSTTSLQEKKGLCDGERFGDQPAVRSPCSGFLVAPDVVVTAGHCVHDAEQFCREESFVFGFGYDSPEATDAEVVSVTRQDVYHCRSMLAWAHEKGRDEELDVSFPIADYAVVQLDRPVEGREPLPLRSDEPLTAGAPVVILGHPVGLPLKVSTGAIVDVPEGAGYFVTDADTLPGSSGSVVLDAETGTVLGAHVSGTPRKDYIETDEGCDVLGETCEAVDPTDRLCRGNLATHTALFAEWVDAI